MTEFYDPKLDTMSEKERTDYYDERIRWVVDYAYNNAPAMKEKLDNAGVRPADIKGTIDLEKIPITKKDDLATLQKENPPFGGFLGVPVEDIKRIFISPGPIYDAIGEEAYARIARIFYVMGFRKGDVVLNTFSYHLVAAGLLFHEALDSFGVKVIATGVGNTDLQLQIMRELKATGYVGTPSFLMTLIKRAEETGFNFKKDFSLETAFLAAEMLPQSLRDSFEKEYGLSTSQVYGTADMGLLAYECKAQSGLHIPEEVFIEIVSPDTGKQLGPGEIGEIVVTPLEKSRPLIRFGTGDLSLFNDEPCSCGRTSSRLLGIVGRVGDSVKVRGMFVHPKELNDAMVKFSQVEAYQAIVNRHGHRDSIVLRVELSSDDIDKPKLAEEILENVSANCRLKFDDVDFVLCGTIPKDGRSIMDERTWE